MTTMLEQYQDHIATLEANGTPLVDFKCPCCGEALKTMAAPSGESWDTTASCPHCDGIYFKMTTGRKVVATTI